MPREYGGYVSNRGTGVDWLGAAEGLSGAVKSVEQAREARRAENERLRKESEYLIGATEQPKSQTLNEFILKGADQGRAKLMEWNRQLKEGTLKGSDFKSRLSNLNEYWSNLAGATKSLDTRLTQAMERQQVGPDGTLPPASAIEAEMQMYFGGLSQLADKNLVIDEDGRVMIGKYDNMGNLVSKEDVKYINNPANVVFNRADLSGMVQSDVKNWGDWSIGRVSDVRQNPQFIKAKTRLTDALVGTPRSAASILVDNTDGDYAVYFNEEDRQQKLAKMKELAKATGEPTTGVENRLIAMRQDANGDYQPVLTQSQLHDAKKLVENEIELQLGRKVESRPATGYSGPSWDQMRKYQEDQDNNLRGYIASREGWNKGDFSGLMQGYKYVPKGSGKNFRIEVYKIDDVDKYNRGSGGLRLVKSAKNPEGLAEFAFDGDPNQSLSDYAQGRQTFFGQGLDQTERFRNDRAPAPKKSSAQGMTTVKMPDGTTGEIPSDQLQAFLKKYPKAKKI